MTPIICIYHGNCADGFTAAWVVREALGSGPDITFIPGVYGQEPPDVTDADVIMVDFSYKRSVLEAMLRQASSILILDHHKTAAADLGEYAALGRHTRVINGQAVIMEVIFDMDRSGAQMAWDHFLPRSHRMKLVDYVGDRDLWKFELPASREVSAWVFSWPYDFERWSGLAHGLEVAGGVELVADQGRAILRKHDKDIAELLKITRREMVIGGHRVPVANLPYTMASDAAGMMAAAAPFAACYFDRADCRVFSLRSSPSGVDVAAVAASYGGGGHAHASGFQVTLGWEGDAP